MQFDSFTFVIFFTEAPVAYKPLPGWRSQKFLLLISSYLFLCRLAPSLIILIWIPFRSTDIVECVHSFKQQLIPDLVFFNYLSLHQILAVAILVMTLGY